MKKVHQKNAAGFTHLLGVVFYGREDSVMCMMSSRFGLVDIFIFTFWTNACGFMIYYCFIFLIASRQNARFIHSTYNLTTVDGFWTRR